MKTTRITALLLAALLMLGCCSAAFAEDAGLPGSARELCQRISDRLEAEDSPFTAEIQTDRSLMTISYGGVEFSRIGFQVGETMLTGDELESVPFEVLVMASIEDPGEEDAENREVWINVEFWLMELLISCLDPTVEDTYQILSQCTEMDGNRYDTDSLGFQLIYMESKLWLIITVL